MLTLGQKSDNAKGDNFNLIRLFLATIVLAGHSYLFSFGSEIREPFHQWTRDITSGRAAVYAFFFISGFLITGSWQRSKTFIDYLLKRILRIYPAFILVLCFCAILIWFICPEFKNFIVQQNGIGPWIQLIAKNALLLQSDSISDINAFAHNPRPGMTNGALWTIPIEFLCYIAILLVGISGILRRRTIALILAILSYEYFILAQKRYDNPYEPLYLCFAFGVLAWLWKDKIPFSGRIAAFSLLVLIGTSHFQPYFNIAFPLAGGYCLLYVAYGPILPLAKWAAVTDLSYGVYLYGGPVQQTLAIYPDFRHPWIILLSALPITLMLAWISWTLVEKPCLSLKRKLSNTKVSAQPLPNPYPESAAPNPAVGGPVHKSANDATG